MKQPFITNNTINFPYNKTGIFIIDIDLNSSNNVNKILSYNKDFNFTIKNNISKEISYINYNTIYNIDVLKNILENNSIIINWTPAKLISKDISSTKEFKIYMYKLSDNSVIVKPAEKYKCSIFEHIFGFGFECENYDPNKIIYIFIK